MNQQYLIMKNDVIQELNHIEDLFEYFDEFKEKYAFAYDLVKLREKLIKHFII